MPTTLKMQGAGEVIRRYRSARNMSVDDLAAKSGCSRRLIQKFESNQSGMSDKKLVALAIAFELRPEALSYECLMTVKPELKSSEIGMLFQAMAYPEKEKAKKRQIRGKRAA